MQVALMKDYWTEEELDLEPEHFSKKFPILN